MSDRADSDRHERCKAMFLSALEQPAEQREQWLQAACGGDEALRQRVVRLLGAHGGETAEAFDVGLTSSSDAKLTVSATLIHVGNAGEQIARYKLLQLLGEGGFGIVWMAEQQQPVRRRVAVKIIKGGMDTREVIARFEAERQALALMDHPNIARVFDAGETEDGRPFVVMELVRGTPITSYCDDPALSVEARLQLFSTVCQAVQHAHQKGIIHRDLKPSNILVSQSDGAPVAKIIDFGIAKAIEARLTDQTLLTRLHAFVGTP